MFELAFSLHDVCRNMLHNYTMNCYTIHGVGHHNFVKIKVIPDKYTLHNCLVQIQQTQNKLKLHT